MSQQPEAYSDAILSPAGNSSQFFVTIRSHFEVATFNFPDSHDFYVF